MALGEPPRSTQALPGLEGVLDPASRELLRLIVDAAPDCIKLFDDRGRLCMINPAGVSIFEADSAEQLLGQRVIDVVSPADRPAVEDLIRRSFAGVGGRIHTEVTGLRGTRRPVELRTLPLREPRGAVKFVLGITRDLTQEQRAEQALAASQQLFSAAFDQAPVGMALAGLDFKLARVNRAFCAMLGYSAEELREKTYADFTHPEDLEKSRELVSRLSTPGDGPIALEKRYVAKNGEVVWARTTSVRLRGAGAEGYFGIVEDIGARRSTQQALREAEAMYRTLVEQIPAVTYVSTLESPGSDIYVSPQIEILTGFTAAEWTTNPDLWTERVHVDDRGRVLQALERSVTEGVPYDVQYRLRRRDGNFGWFHDRGARVLDETGRARFFQGACFDVTERKQADETLRVREGQLLDAQRLGRIGSWEWDLATGRIRGSDELFRIFGSPPRESVSFEGFLRGVHPDDRPRVKVVVGGSRRRGRSFDFEHRIVRPDGDVRTLRSRGEATLDADGRRVVRLFGIAQDITERTRGEERLRRTVERMQSLFAIAAAVNADATPDDLHGPALNALARGVGADRAALLLLDREGVMRFVAWRGLSQAYRAAVEGHSPWRATSVDPVPILVPDVAGELDPALEPHRDRILAEGIRAMAFVPIFHGRLLGKFMLYYDAPRQMAPEEVEFALTVARHIAIADERRRGDAALRQSHDQLRNLAARVEQGREEERTRIAREVHDELGQALTALKLDLAWLEAKLKHRHPSLAAKARESAKVADATIRAVRRISTALRPVVLDDLGIVAAVEWLVHDFQRHSGIRCRLVSEFESLPLGEEQATQVFRLCQEALTNVARHSRATQASVTLARDGAGLRVEIRDNGVGIGPGKSRDPRSHGLAGMRERARLLGGEIGIVAGPDTGTLITLRCLLQ